MSQRHHGHIDQREVEKIWLSNATATAMIARRYHRDPIERAHRLVRSAQTFELILRNSNPRTHAFREAQHQAPLLYMEAVVGFKSAGMLSYAKEIMTQSAVPLLEAYPNRKLQERAMVLMSQIDGALRNALKSQARK